MITRIRIGLESVMVYDDADMCGAGEWYLIASIDTNVPNQQLGNPNYEFEARSGNPLPLAPVAAQWSLPVDVSGMAAGSSVRIRLRVRDKDVFGYDELGEATGTVPWPFNTPNLRIRVDGSVVDGRRYWHAEFLVTVEEEVATGAPGPQQVPVQRNAAGNVTSFSTVKGVAFLPRVEVCPVIPVPPSPPTHMPPRPPLLGGLAAGFVPPAAQLLAAPTPALNSIRNPAVIPVLDAVDPDLANRQARLAVTYYEPNNLDTTKLHWRLVSGPAVIIGPSDGLTINVRGDAVAFAAHGGADTMAVFEVRWENDTGPLLATYRAWVGRLGTQPYRVTFLDGATPAWVTSAEMTSAVANNIMQVVRAIHYQAGIMLVPDPVVTGFDGAVLFPAGNADAIYQVSVPDGHTRNVNHQIISRSTRRNFRPGVINFAIIHSSFVQGATSEIAAAVDRNGILGVATNTQWKAGKLWYGGGGQGAKKNLDGSPSASWIKPSGVPSDTPGIKKEMKTIHPTDRVKQAKSIDSGYVSARNTKKVPFTAALMGQLYACHMTVIWGRNLLIGAPPLWTQAQYEWNCGINFAHELGHILGLAHRGCAGYKPLPVPLPASMPSADGMDCADTTGYVKGHPWNENIMTYGYGMTPPLAHNIDLIQAMVVRAHPAVTY